MADPAQDRRRIAAQMPPGDAEPMAGGALLAFSCFDTALGACAVAWGGQGIVGAQLPEGDAQALRRRMQRRFPDAVERPPEGDSAAAVAGVQALLRGEPVDFSTLALDWRGLSDFHRRVYRRALAIPPGRTLSYGELAREIGEPGAARAVGQAMGANPFAPIVPCHRVLAAGGRSGGFSAHGGAATKLRLLAIEGARPDDQPSLF
jgi:methylated-DNA-[protein]-cysteine S-methyltransferase